jgi:hypothetical protein
MSVLYFAILYIHVHCVLYINVRIYHSMKIPNMTVITKNYCAPDTKECYLEIFLLYVGS